MPFSYQGQKGAKEAKDLKKDAYWKDLRGSNINILSVIPVFVYAPRRTVKIKFIRGKLKWGLKTKWSSLRPIVSDVKIREFVKPLAKTEALIANSQIKYDRHDVKNWLKRFFLERLKSVEIGKGGVGIELVEKDKKKQPRLRFFEEYASAWFKNFNKKEPKSGFVRIWDFSPRVITDAMKEELYNVATYRLK